MSFPHLSRAFLLPDAHSPKTSCQFFFLENPSLLSLTHTSLFLLWKSTRVKSQEVPGVLNHQGPRVPHQQRALKVLGRGHDPGRWERLGTEGSQTDSTLEQL